MIPCVHMNWQKTRPQSINQSMWLTTIQITNYKKVRHLNGFVIRAHSRWNIAVFTFACCIRVNLMKLSGGVSDVTDWNERKIWFCTFSWKVKKCYTIPKCLIQGFMCSKILNPNRRSQRSKTIITFVQL